MNIDKVPGSGAQSRTFVYGERKRFCQWEWDETKKIFIFRVLLGGAWVQWDFMSETMNQLASEMNRVLMTIKPLTTTTT